MNNISPLWPSYPITNRHTTVEFHAIVEHLRQTIPKYFNASYWYVEQNTLFLMDLQTGSTKHKIWLENGIITIGTTRTPIRIELASPTALEELTQYIIALDKEEDLD